MSIPFIEAFPHDYECEAIEETRHGLPRWYYPGGSQFGGEDGYLIRVESKIAGPWQGIFAFGDLSTHVANGIYSCPDQRRLCVISNGEGYYVNADNPADCETVPLLPVLEVFPVPAVNLLVMHDWTDFAAYGPTGREWRTPRLSWDGLWDVRVEGTVLAGKSWCAPTDEAVEFQIDLTTGKCQGGAWP